MEFYDLQNLLERPFVDDSGEYLREHLLMAIQSMGSDKIDKRFFCGKSMIMGSHIFYGQRLFLCG